MPLAPDKKSVPSHHGRRRQAIVQSLLTDIFQGRVRTGQRLVTQELADRFGVSHTPIREALIELAGIGIVDLFPNRGVVVRRVTTKDVREVCQVRRALECEAVRRACGRVELGALHSLVAEIRGFRRQRRPPSPPIFVRPAKRIAVCTT